MTQLELISRRDKALIDQTGLSMTHTLKGLERSSLSHPSIHERILRTGRPRFITHVHCLPQTPADANDIKATCLTSVTQTVSLTSQCQELTCLLTEWAGYQRGYHGNTPRCSSWAPRLPSWDDGLYIRDVRLNGVCWYQWYVLVPMVSAGTIGVCWYQCCLLIPMVSAGTDDVC